ncbi:signal peptide peptidase SppA, 36K type [hydrothermal vent metagenome]|uniref:Signal peptide peptidase SppA, 36K type n=1 Tax=hydrothermal vent metagenome TaxID=652676 RepID=A0A3B1BSY5_9ZZZZ
MAHTKSRFWSAFLILFFLAVGGGLFIAAIAYLFFPSDDGILATTLSSNKIAIVRIKGVILDSEHTINQIRRWTKDEDVKAIILRINSPGGAVAPSQEIYSEVIKASKKKPLITSMGTVAASGGYYIAAASARIIADPGTLTGSIGVIMMFSNFQKLMDKIGLESVVLKSGKFKDTGSPYRPFTKEDRELLQGVIKSIYTQFVTDVASGRNMDIDDVRKLADGRVYTGEQALENGLVDQLGTMRDAIDIAAKMADMKAEPVIVEDKGEPGFLKWLLGDELDMKIPGTAGLSSGVYYLWPSW